MKPDLFKSTSRPAPAPQRKVEVEHCAPGGCEFLMATDGGKWRECGQQAKFRWNKARSLKYCQIHADHVRSRQKRGGTLEIVEL